MDENSGTQRAKYKVVGREDMLKAQRVLGDILLASAPFALEKLTCAAVVLGK